MRSKHTKRVYRKRILRKIKLLNDKGETEVIRMIACSDCKLELPESFIVKHQRKDYCIRCVRKFNIFQCGHCSSPTRISNQVRMNEKDVCQACAAAHYIPCASCDERFDGEQIKSVAGRKYCGACYNELFAICPDCNQPVRKTDMHSLTGLPHALCNTCVNNKYAECRVCRTWHKRDAMTRTDRGWYCGTCNPRHEVRENSYKPTPVFFGKETMTFLGVELEVECTDPLAAIRSMDMTEEFYVKRDGSLSPKGLEFVSMPCTLDYHKNNIKWEERCANLVKVGARSHQTDTCGLHVHMSSDRMSKLDCMKFSWFVHKELRSIALLARRTKPFGNDVRTPETVMARIVEHKEWKNPGRYDTLNWLNPHTVEFRLPKGTLNANTLLATLELCDAALEYTHALTFNQVKSGTFDGFLMWCQSNKRNRARYSNMLGFYEKKGKLTVLASLKKSMLSKEEHLKKVAPSAVIPVIPTIIDEVEDPRYCRL